MRFPLLPILAAWMLPMLVTVAQEDPTARTYTFYTLAWETSVAEVYYLDRGEVRQAFAPNISTAGPYSITSARPVVPVYFSKPAINEQGQWPQPDIAAPLRTDTSSLLIFSTNTEGAHSVNTVALAPEHDDYYGAYLFYNLTQEEIIGQINGEQFSVKPGRRTVVPSPTDKPEAVLFQCASQTTEGWNLFYRSRWSIIPERRALVFFHSTTGEAASIDIKRIYQVRVSTDPSE